MTNRAIRIRGSRSRGSRTRGIAIGALLLALSIIPARAFADAGALAKARQSVEAADYTLKGRLVRVDENGTRTSFGVSIKAHWFPNVLRVLLEVNSPATARVHLLLEMRPEGRNSIQIVKPGDTKPSALPYDKWTDGLAGGDFSLEDFLDVPYFWAGQRDAGRVKLGDRTCELLISTPGAGDMTHFSSVKSWLDLDSGFPVYVEKTLKGTGAVKEFTYFDLRKTEGVWSASRVEGKIRGRSDSTLLMIEHGSPKAHLELKDFSSTQLMHFSAGP
jgi:hypothetical protein